MLTEWEIMLTEWEIMLTEWEIMLNFNHKKCQIMHISNLRSQEVLYDYTMRGSKLEIVDSYPYLGVTISSNLKWNDQVNNVIKSITIDGHAIRRNILMCSKDTKSMTYNTLVRPHLEYASSVWDPYTDELVEANEKVQRRAARFLKSGYRRTSSVGTMINELKWTSTAARRQQTDLLLSTGQYTTK